MKRKSILSIFLALLLTMALLAGCDKKNEPPQSSGASEGSASEKSSSENSGQEPNAEPVKLKVMFLSWTAQPQDLGIVQEELNGILEEKIGASVELLPVNGGEYQQKLNLMLQNGDELDLLVTGTGMAYPVQASTGQLLPLSGLLESHGQGILSEMETYLSATRMPDGEVYAVPVLQSYAATTTFVMRQDLVDKYSIDLASIKTLDDLEEVFALIKKNEPEVIPVIPEAPGSGVFGLGLDILYDPLGDSVGVLPNYGQGSEVVNLFETPEYEAWVRRLRKWYLDGYILQDAATNNETAAALLMAGRGFGHFTGVAVGAADSASISYGMPMAAVSFGEPFISGGSIATISWAIARQSKNPEKAMEFLNLLYTDREIVNLIDYGIEGKHYIKVSDNEISSPEGLDAANHPYNFNLSWEFGNIFLSYVPFGTDAQIWEKARASNDSALLSNALGFTVDVEPVKTELAAVMSVAGQYMNVLGTGSVDPDKYLPEFIEKLKDAGIDTIVGEKQRQFDEWKAAQGK